MPIQIELDKIGQNLAKLNKTWLNMFILVKLGQTWQNLAKHGTLFWLNLVRIGKT